jgi:hypothetical protein
MHRRPAAVTRGNGTSGGIIGKNLNWSHMSFDPAGDFQPPV